MIWYNNGMKKHPAIIIGTGLAGYNLAREFRKIDTETRLQLFTVDKGRYYSKPVLSNALTNQKTADELALADAGKMQQQLQADIFTETAVESIDTQDKHIVANGQLYPYSKLVFACGASQISPLIAGDAVSHVCSINNLMQYAEFRKRLEPKQHIAIIGAGFIGCEFANDLNNVGYKVSVIAHSAYPLDRLIPENVGKSLQAALSKEGVEWHLGKNVTQINKVNSRFQITLNDGTVLNADNVLMSVGLRANTTLAQAAGISVNKGIVANAFLETSADDVYALGDCAEVAGEIRQFVAPINYCVKGLAKTLTGEPTAIQFPHMPIVVKTPACPITIVNPSKNNEGRWQIEENDLVTKALFYNDDNQLTGFVLTGKGKELMLARQQLLQQL
ncbi:FAD-dependent oxidoreductase [Candidiatus Paracoxiella cheracis]|uniref:FAD-dependent oxidoreductase n=1 Tax=Candidiatus Paracoxiella cheracis TaxID=3405120 RepID=UPI003BF5D882